MYLRVLITSKEASVIIGRQGQSLARIRESSKAELYVSENYQAGHQVAEGKERILTIRGSAECVAKAAGLVVRTINNEEWGKPTSPTAPAYRMRLIFPGALMGALIGRNGTQFREIEEKSAAKLLAEPEPLAGSTERVLVATGVSDAIHIAVYYLCTVYLSKSEIIERAQATMRHYDPAKAARINSRERDRKDRGRDRDGDQDRDRDRDRERERDRGRDGQRDADRESERENERDVIDNRSRKSSGDDLVGAIKNALKEGDTNTELIAALKKAGIDKILNNGNENAKANGNSNGNALSNRSTSNGDNKKKSRFFPDQTPEDIDDEFHLASAQKQTKHNTADKVAEQSITVPKKYAGYLVGKRGAVLREIRVLSGAQIDLTTDDDNCFIAIKGIPAKNYKAIFYIHTRMKMLGDKDPVETEQ